MKNQEAIDEAVATIESAANGIAGAGMVGDVGYAEGRHTEIKAAVEVLSTNKGGVDTAGISARAKEMMGCAGRRDVTNLYRLNIEIGEILAPLCN